MFNSTNISLGTLISSRFHFWWSCCNVWCLGFLSSLYILAINLLSHSAGGLFTRKTIPFAAQQLFNFMKSHLERSYLYLYPVSNSCFLLAVSEFQVLCCGPWAILSWYVCSWKDQSSLFPLPVATQCFQYHLLNRLPLILCALLASFKNQAALRDGFFGSFTPPHGSMCLFHACTVLFYTMIMSGVVILPALFSLLKIAFAMILFLYTYLGLVF